MCWCGTCARDKLTPVGKGPAAKQGAALWFGRELIFPDTLIGLKVKIENKKQLRDLKIE